MIFLKGFSERKRRFYGFGGFVSEGFLFLSAFFCKNRTKFVKNSIPTKKFQNSITQNPMFFLVFFQKRAYNEIGADAEKTGERNENS